MILKIFYYKRNKLISGETNFDNFNIQIKKEGLNGIFFEYPSKEFAEFLNVAKVAPGFIFTIYVSFNKKEEFDLSEAFILLYGSGVEC